MVVIGIFHSEMDEERAIRLAGEHSDEIYEEKIAENKFLLSMRAKTLAEAQRLGGIFHSAGADRIEIDTQAA